MTTPFTPSFFTPSFPGRILRARLPGRCTSCRGPVRPGELIAWRAEAREAQHLRCAAPPLAEAWAASAPWRTGQECAECRRDLRAGEPARLRGRAVCHWSCAVADGGDLATVLPVVQEFVGTAARQAAAVLVGCGVASQSVAITTDCDWVNATVAVAFELPGWQLELIDGALECLGLPARWCGASQAPAWLVRVETLPQIRLPARGEDGEES
jgi:hypothetical protein